MFHWYKILSTSGLASAFKNDERLIADNKDASRFADKKTKTRWFWLGLAEAAPIFFGLVASAYHHLIFPYDYFTLGVILSVLLAFQLKDDSPPPPISLKH